MKIIGNITKGLFIICLPVLLFTACVGWVFNSLWLYQYGFHKYDVSQTTGLAQAELDKAASGLIHYFNSGEEDIHLFVVKQGESFELFTEREIVHLRDVKGLIWLDYRVLLGTLIYILGYAGIEFVRRKERRRLAWVMVRGSVLTLGLMLVLRLGILLDFNQLFLRFHLISFSNEFWQLDPTRDYLIMLFPQGFWFDVFLFGTLVIAASAVALLLISGSYLVFSRKTALT